jgi:hypothetical protein
MGKTDVEIPISKWPLLTGLARIFALGLNIFLERQLHLRDDNLDSLILLETQTDRRRLVRNREETT